jgi:hypothetical protein
MTLVSQIITDAFRLSNLLALGVTPTALQQEEALRYLDRLIKSVFGNEAGDPLVAFPIGRNNVSRPSGYPWWDTVPSNDWFVPKNTRVMLNVDTAGINLYLHPDPDDGSRFAAIDVSDTLGTYPITVHGNGRTIEDSLSITMDTDGFDAEWFYRADLGNWMKYSPLALEDNFPFPVEFEDYFVAMLALRINPSYGAAMDEQAGLVLSRSRTQFRARYTQNIPTGSELALVRMSKMSVDRDRWGNSYTLYNPNAMFTKGWPW